jgi:hypothetical protein
MTRYYQEKIAICNDGLQQTISLNTALAVLRLISFCGIIATLYYACTHLRLASWLIVASSIVIFLMILKASEKTGKKLAYRQALLRIYSQELASLESHQFPNSNGAEFQDYAHPYTNDLDIFGKNSLFHAINRTQTVAGYNYLAQQLQKPLLDKNKILQRQAAVQELQQKQDFVFHILASLAAKEEAAEVSHNNLLTWLQQPNPLHLSAWTMRLIYILPFFNLFFIIACFVHAVFGSLLMVFLGIQILILYRYHKTIQQMKYDLDIIIHDIANFDVYANVLNEEKFEASALQLIQQKVLQFKPDIHQLHSILNTFDMGDSFIGALGNILFLNHIKNAVQLEKWKANHQTTLPEVIIHISELETVLSISVFAINHPEFIFPKIADNSILQATQLGHPLIDKEKSVNNDMTILQNDIFIITGANMAGKSTFLRTVGVNLLLAELGAPVCASSFQFTPVSLFSSMRTVDDLGNGISYFYAEALRMKQMLTFVADGKPYLLLMDELFRGTNSDDRLKSSLSFIRKISRYPEVSALIATHDLGVTILEEENPDKIKNYCFECKQQGEQLTFDYLLKRGITRSNNAYQLLKQMEIVE